MTLEEQRKLLDVGGDIERDCDSKRDNHEYPYIFGLCHEPGWVLEKDLNKALAYYRKAAKCGYEKAATAAKRVEK